MLTLYFVRLYLILTNIPSVNTTYTRVRVRVCIGYFLKIKIIKVIKNNGNVSLGYYNNRILLFVSHTCE